MPKKKKTEEPIEVPAAPKKFEKDIKVKGDLIFNNLDRRMARLHMADAEEIVSKRELELIAALFPADYDPARMEITGKYRFDVKIKEK